MTPTLRPSRLLSHAFASVLLSSLAACGGGNGAASASGQDLQALASTQPQASAPNFSAEAVSIRLGLDANRNGSLDANEVSYTEVVCTSGGTGGMRMALVDEPAGATCPAGGKRMLAGPDANGDGVLQVEEASSSAYVCHGQRGADGAPGTAGANGATGAAGPAGAASLMSTTPEPAGANCAAGGSRVRSGADTNGNATLDAAEVLQTAYVCHGTAGTPGTPGAPGTPGTPGAPGTPGTNGAASLLRTTPEPAGANCTHGGTRVQNGLDADASGTLDAAEVAQTAYVCNPPPAGLAWVEVSADRAAAPNTGYVHTGTGSIQITLPQAPPVGSIVRVVGANAGLWSLRAGGTDVIRTTNLPVPWRWGPAWTEEGPAVGARDVAMSEDGSHLVLAASNEPLWVSNDHGQTWQRRGPTQDWRTVAMSADGKTMFAAGMTTGIYVSRNWGADWTEIGAGGSWRKVATSRDGARVGAIGTVGTLTNMFLLSGNGGATWDQVPLPDLEWTALAVSGSGTVIVAGATTGPLFLSTDGGASFASRLGGGNFTAAAASHDGRALIVAQQGGAGAAVHAFGDYGATWNSYTRGSVGYAVAISQDGQRRAWGTSNGLLLAAEPGNLWADASFPMGNVTSVACSSDCGRIVALKAGSPRLFVSRSTTTPGGSLEGGANSSVELQYLGASGWVVLGYSGTLAAR